MKNLVLLTIITALMLSCAKKKTKETLIGEWKVTSYLESINGAITTEEISSGYQLTLIFEDAFLKNEGYCPMTWRETYPSGPVSSSLEYKITNGGNGMDMRNPTNEDVVIAFTIVTLEDEAMILEARIEGAASTLTLEKQ